MFHVSGIVMKTETVLFKFANLSSNPPSTIMPCSLDRRQGHPADPPTRIAAPTPPSPAIPTIFPNLIKEL
jgi:hypothetical protein